MYSTRGVKFKFSEGEKVLCYEPDPTKAKVLYDSKVLELNVSRDGRGRKVPEYLIHFSGWSSSWDRCVKEEFILPDTEENRILQTKLAKEAAACLKGKRKTKLPPLIKETLLKKEKEVPPPSPPKPEVKEESSESESSDDESDKNVVIEIPNPLKELLEEDWYYVTQRDKVIKLPCEYNVVSILESFVKHMAAKLLCASPPKNSKNGKEVISDNVESRIHFCKEVMDGIRVYFDFTLPHLLLYRQEKKQFYTVGNTCIPVYRIKSDATKVITKKEVTDNSVLPSPTVVLQKELPKTHSPQASNKSGSRNPAANQKSQVVPMQTDEEVNDLSPKLRACGRSPQTKEFIKSKKPRIIGSRKGLRSGDKSKTTDDVSSNTNLNITHSEDQELECVSPSQPESPPPTPTSPFRQTRRSTHNSVTPQPPVSPNDSTTRSPPTQKRTTFAPTVTLSHQPTVNVQPLLTIATSNQSSSASSTHSSQISPKPEKGAIKLINNSCLLKEIVTWKLLPDHVYEQTPAAPSLVYGVQHLLRLFVKLPELIYKMNMSRRKLDPLLDTLHTFLEYLTQKRDELFFSSTYIDSCEEFTEGDYYMKPVIKSD